MYIFLSNLDWKRILGHKLVWGKNLQRECKNLKKLRLLYSEAKLIITFGDKIKKNRKYL